MIQIEPNLLKNYKFVLQTNKIPSNTHGYYMKWLRFYLDFCHKYGFRETDSGSQPPFIEKLRSKKENEKGPSAKGFTREAVSGFPADPPMAGQAKDPKQKWQKALTALANEIKVRHYSPKTLKAYRTWVYKIQAYLNSKASESLDSELEPP